MKGFDFGYADRKGMSRVWAMRTAPFLGPIWLYKKYVSPVLPGACRHLPTCSEYTFQAIRQRGVAQGLVMGTWRLLRCQPWGTSGYDPVEAFRWPWEPKVPGVHEDAQVSPRESAPDKEGPA